MIIVKDNIVVATVNLNNVCPNDLSTRGESFYELEGNLRDGYADGKVYPSPGLHYKFDASSKTWTYNLDSGKAAKLASLSNVVNAEILKVFPDATKAQAIRIQQQAYQTQIQNATDANLETINFTFTY